MSEEKKKVGFFTDENGYRSLRRLLAFIFAIVFIVIDCGSILWLDDWKIALVCGGLALIGCLLMMFFTTWGDVANVTKAIRGKD